MSKEKNAVQKFWNGDVENCDFCSKPLTTTFVDGATTSGPWANMCPSCFSQHGRGVGQGVGQKYKKQADGKWLKVAG